MNKKTPENREILQGRTPFACAISPAQGGKGKREVKKSPAAKIMQVTEIGADL